MRILLLNQCFHPDVMATGQQLTSLAQELAQRGHQLTVITGDRGYDQPAIRFARRETWKGIDIIRIPSLALGKATKWRRALTFSSFLVFCSLRLLLLPRFDIVLALTSPPLISLLGALFVKLRGGRFFFWVMDLNPDEAIAAGWLKERSIVAGILSSLLRYSLRKAHRVIVLDRFMKQRIEAKGIPTERIEIVPPWSLDDAIHYDEQGRRSFREQYHLADRFVVMYSGNHSPCHPLDTLLEAALRLSNHTEMAFCFVGGGSEQSKVEAFASHHRLSNIQCLPYQPLEKLSSSLSAADLHAVVMGNAFPGIIHPCKVYNILTVGTPFLYVGPKHSPISDIASQSRNGYYAFEARHGEVDTVVEGILQAAAWNKTQSPPVAPEFAKQFSKSVLLPRMIEILEQR